MKKTRTKISRVEYKRRWQREHKKQALAASRKYQRSHRKLQAKNTQKWREENAATLTERRGHWHRKYAYGITKEQYEKKFKKQKGKCSICGALHIPGRRTGLVIDHDHKTKIFRGLLCQTCNRALGLLKDNIKILKKAIRYLKKTKRASNRWLMNVKI